MATEKRVEQIVQIAAIVLLGVFGGVIAFGFVGIFLGPTLLAVGYNLVRRWTESRAATPPAPPVPRGG